MAALLLFAVALPLSKVSSTVATASSTVATTTQEYDDPPHLVAIHESFTTKGIGSKVLDLCKHPTDSARFFVVRDGSLSEIGMDPNGTMDELREVSGKLSTVLIVIQNYYSH